MLQNTSTFTMWCCILQLLNPDLLKVKEKQNKIVLSSDNSTKIFHNHF